MKPRRPRSLMERTHRPGTPKPGKRSTCCRAPIVEKHHDRGIYMPVCESCGQSAGLAYHRTTQDTPEGGTA